MKNLKVALEEVAKLAATLKRERDEAREQVASLQLDAKYHDEADALRKLRERERDKAREEWGKASMDAAQLLSQKTKVMAERDEAREKVEQQREEIVRLNGATNHAGGTPLKIALRERDEARELADRYRVAFCSAKGDLVPTPFPWEGAK